MDLELSAAIDAVLSSGKYIASQYGTALTIEEKSNYQDLVTNVDRGSQEIISSALKSRFPDIGLYGEEGLNVTLGPDRWIIDGLDGTTNFIHGVPFFSVSLALERDGELVLGVVYDPMRDELFSAQRGQGTFLNGKRVQVSATRLVRQSLLATGFPYNMSAPGNNLSEFGQFKLVAQEVRTLGSAALELAYVACGRLDGYWEMGLSPWDTAGSVLLLEEAGGRITERRGHRFLLESECIVASNGQIHEEMLQLLESANLGTPFPLGTS